MTFRDSRFKGKVAIVSGGADGMGAACVNQLSAEGAKVVILDIKIDLARTISAKLQENGASVEALEVDVPLRQEIGHRVKAQLRFVQLGAKVYRPRKVKSE